MQHRRQSTPHILMVKPVNFGFNEMTYDNHFQETIPNMSKSEIKRIGREEFDRFTQMLRSEGVNIIEVEDTPEPLKTDSTFPNNWISTHLDGSLITYPLFAPNRRWERRRGIINLLDTSFKIENEIDLSHYEEDDLFLEGTGSMILDRLHSFCYACLSKRTDHQLLKIFCEKTDYKLVEFHSVDPHGDPIYHTNVMMAIGTEFAVVCLESIHDLAERKKVVDQLENTRREVVDITFDQTTHFCGNILEVVNDKGEKLLAMSSKAFHAFTDEQKAILEKSVRIIHAPIDTIEQIGGGGTRCMMAEIFLEEKS